MSEVLSVLADSCLNEEKLDTTDSTFPTSVNASADQALNLLLKLKELKGNKDLFEPLEEEEPEEEEGPKFMTRSFLKRLSGVQEKKYVCDGEEDEEDDEEEPISNPYSKANHTSIKVNQLPSIYQALMEALPAEERILYNEGKIQHLIIESALDKVSFPKGSNEKLLLYTLTTILGDEKYKNYTYFDSRVLPNTIARKNNSENVADVLKRYDEYINSPEETRKREFRCETNFKHEWTEADIERFKEAFKKFGNSPRSNKKIAEFIGNGVQSNHVAFFKLQMRKKQKTDDNDELPRSISEDGMSGFSEEENE